jgi:hypothetical protein
MVLNPGGVGCHAEIMGTLSHIVKTESLLTKAKESLLTEPDEEDGDRRERTK